MLMMMMMMMTVAVHLHWQTIDDPQIGGCYVHNIQKCQAVEYPSSTVQCRNSMMNTAAKITTIVKYSEASYRVCSIVHTL